MKTFVDHQKCQGHGRCVWHAPDLFGYDEDDKGVPLRDPVTEHEIRDARTAQAACPEGAIQLIEASHDSHA